MKELADEELNIALCEWLGWTEIVRGCGRHNNGPIASLPNHITGIEALGHMHEAEKRLTREQRIMLQEELGKNVTKENAAGEWFFIHATARQRAIALLRVVRPELFA